MKVKEVADCAVVRLKAAANPPGANVPFGQLLQVPQRPASFQYPIKNQPQQNHRMDRTTACRLVGRQQTRQVQAFQKFPQADHPIQTILLQILAQRYVADMNLCGIGIKKIHTLLDGSWLLGCRFVVMKKRGLDRVGNALGTTRHGESL